MVVDQQSWSSEALPLVGATIRVEEEKQQEDGMRSNGNVVQEAEEEEQDVSIMTNPVFALQRSTSIPRDIPAPLTGTRKEGAATSAGTQARNTESGRVGTAHEGVATIQDHVRAGDSQVATAKINKTAIWILIAYALFAAGYMCRELQLGILNTATLTKEDVLRISQKQIDETLRQATVSGRTEEDILSIFNQRFQETLQKATVSELTEEDVLRISQKQIDEVLSQATVSGLTEEDVVSIFNQQIKETLQEVKSPGSINEDIIQVVKQQVQLALEEANGFGTTCNVTRGKAAREPFVFQGLIQRTHMLQGTTAKVWLQLAFVVLAAFLCRTLWFQEMPATKFSGPLEWTNAESHAFQNASESWKSDLLKGHHFVLGRKYQWTIYTDATTPGKIPYVWLGVTKLTKSTVTLDLANKFGGNQKDCWGVYTGNACFDGAEAYFCGAAAKFGSRSHVVVTLDLTEGNKENGTLSISVNGQETILVVSNMRAHVEGDVGYVPAVSCLYASATILSVYSPQWSWFDFLILMVSNMSRKGP